MKVDEGLPSMMYLAVTIMEIFILCKVIPENAMQYAKTLGVNCVLVYLYSIWVNQFNQNSTVKLVQRIVFIGIALLIGSTIARGLNLLLLFALFVVPIIVAFGMIFVQGEHVLFEDFINLETFIMCDSVTELESFAFYHCGNLKNITFSKNLIMK